MALQREPFLFAESEMRGAWPWAHLEAHTYSMIMADPPWHFTTRSEKGEGKSPQAQYDTMSLKDIAALPVALLAAEDAMLWLWATAPMLDVQIDVLKSWDFTFKTSGVWTKRTVNKHLTFGTGYIFRNCHEIILIGTRGKPRTTRSTRSVIDALARRHSEKPEEAYIAAEKLIPDARRVELFSRTSRPGWDTWGNEAGKFDGEANHAHKRTRLRKSRNGVRNAPAGGGDEVRQGTESLEPA